MAQETDVELLEAYLDGELSSVEMEAVQARLEADAALAGALRELRGEQAARDAYFASIEPGEGDVERVVAKAYARIERGRRGRLSLRRWVGVSAVAASLVVAFVLGRVGRVEEKPAAGASATAVATMVYQVAITDESGNVIATQKFDSLEQAREFTEDLRQWQELQSHLASGRVTVRSARF